MPYIQVKANVKISCQAAEEIKEVLGQAISRPSGKSEGWFMVFIEDGCQMFSGGEGSRPIAMVGVKILGSTVDQEGAKHMTREMTGVLGGVLGVLPDNMYIKYETSPNWGWDGTNF